MFNQIDLQFKPSVYLATLLGLPFATSLVLATTIDASHTVKLILIICLLLVAWQLIYQFAYLKASHSVHRLRLVDGGFILTDHSGESFRATPILRNLLHPQFSLISFSCEALNHLSDNTNDLSQEKLQSFKRICQRLFGGNTTRKDTRHLIICRYNVQSLNDFRRLRVQLALASSSF